MKSQESQSTIEGSALFSNRVISEHLRSLGYPERSIGSMERCGDSTGFHMLSTCDCGTRPFELSYSCSLRTCVRCSKKRKKLMRRKYLSYLESLAFERGKDSFTFLTISPKNYYDFKSGLKDLTEAFKKFRRRKYLRERIKGCLYVIESKFSIEKGWNLHIHAILYGRKLDNRIRGSCLDCRQNLIKFNKDREPYCANKNCKSSNVVYHKDSKIVSLFKECSGRDVNIHITDRFKGKSLSKSPSFVLNYMLKYVSSNKDDFETVEQTAEYINGIRKQRLVNTVGVFFNRKYRIEPMRCPCCGSSVIFEFDYEVSLIMEFNRELAHAPPPSVRIKGGENNILMNYGGFNE